MPGWQTLGGKRDIGWAEAIGFEILAIYLCEEDPGGQHLAVFGDNVGVVEGWRNGRSRNAAVNDVFKRIHTLLERANAPTLHPRYIPSAENPADAPSHGVYPPAALLLPPITLPRCLDSLLVDAQLPRTAAERSRDHTSRSGAGTRAPPFNSHEETEREKGFHRDDRAVEQRAYQSRWHAREDVEAEV